MSRKNGMNSNKIKKQKNIQKYSSVAAQQTLQYYVSKDVKSKKNGPKRGYNNSVDKDKGIQWFNEGLALDEAPEELRNNISFLNGFNYAYRLKLINDKLYELGIEYYNNGVPLYNIPEKYSENEYFLKGYNSFNKTR